MTHSEAVFHHGTHMSTTVKWYDPARGCGFLAPDDGSPAICCRAPALAAVGLETLLAGAAVACETEQGLRGPEVSQIVAVDFSASVPVGEAQGSVGEAQGSGRTAAGAGEIEARTAAPGPAVRGKVKWFDPAKGYGFVEPEDGSADVFCHLTAVQASGRDTLPQGGAVSCEVVWDDRGPQVSRILSVEPAAGPGAADRSQPVDVRHRSAQVAAPAPAAAEIPGSGRTAAGAGAVEADPAASGREVRAAVKWFDPVKGYGFLEPEDGSADVFCHLTVVQASGRDTLPQRGAVCCEVVRGDRGPEVSRILSVEPAAGPVAADRGQPVDARHRSAQVAAPAPTVAEVSGSGRTAGEAEADPAASGRTVRALVKWFHPLKGYGFLEPEDGSADVFCHLTVVQASGRDTLPHGAAVRCEVVRGDRGPQVSRILSVEPAAGPGAADGGQPVDARHRSPPVQVDAPHRSPQVAAPAPAAAEMPGTVKFFDPARGFGFVVPDNGGREVFVHSTVLFRSGMADLAPGQRVLVRTERVPRGVQAMNIEPM